MRKQNEKGAFTIEATLTLFLFTFAFITIVSLASVARVESTTQYAIDQVAKEISRYCYIADKANLLMYPSDGSKAKVDNIDDAVQAMYNFMDTTTTAVTKNNQNTNQTIRGMLSGVTKEDFNSITSSARAMYSSLGPVLEDPKGSISALAEIVVQKGASKLVSRVIAQPLCKAIIPQYLTNKGDVDAALEKMGVIGGLDGMDFSMSSFLMDGRTINVVLVYSMDVKGYGIFDQKVVVKQTASTAAWLSGGGKLSELEEESYWQKSDVARGKAIVDELQNDNIHRGIREGIGADVYDQDSNTFTSVHSINVFNATYSQYTGSGSSGSANDYVLDEAKIKATVKGYAQALNKNVNKIGDNIILDDGTDCQIATEDVMHRSREITLVVPFEASKSDDAKSKLNTIAEEIEEETGVKVSVTYRDNAL